MRCYSGRWSRGALLSAHRVLLCSIENCRRGGGAGLPRTPKLPTSFHEALICLPPLERQARPKPQGLPVYIACNVMFSACHIVSAWYVYWIRRIHASICRSRCIYI